MKALRRYYPGTKTHLPFLSLCVSAFLCCCLAAKAQNQDTLTFRVVSYNVENLFDIRHDSLKNDHEFLPTSTRHWNYSRYRKKLNDLARTPLALGEWNPPALVALCEVENDSVLRDLTQRSALREAGYRYLVTHSADERGIDVALLYRRELFKPLTSQNIRIHQLHPQARPTRDILHVSGLLLNGDTLDVLVVHFPSRSGGAKVSEPYRLQAARRVKQTTDSLMAIRHYPQILLLGDFNDYPTNQSIRDVLQAEALPTDEAPDEKRLYHLLARKAKEQKHYGSYKYQGEWGLLDHLIVSGNLLKPSAPLYTHEGQADVARLPFLLVPDPKYGGEQPFRTYLGPRYQGGISDHLPVWADFRLLY